MSDSDKPFVGLSLMIEDEFVRAAHPLFEAGEVEILEWTFDVGWGDIAPSAWIYELLDYYSCHNRLVGHGVTYSPLSIQNSERQQRWLSCLREECEIRRYRYISEHFGWMSAGNFHQGTPLPIIKTPETVGIGVENLRKLAETAQTPIGLENLAFAFGLRDVEEQGAFLEELLVPFDGFLVLDLHNIYCQSHNFKQPSTSLLETYPLHRVREIHISGGSWSSISNGLKNTLIRRDTHDNRVPEEVFDLLPAALKKCPNVETIIFERIGNSLGEDSEADRFREDFKRLKRIVQRSRK